MKKEYLKPELVEYEELRNLTAQELIITMITLLLINDNIRGHYKS
jgi:hypothetical protein